MRIRSTKTRIRKSKEMELTRAGRNEPIKPRCPKSTPYTTNRLAGNYVYAPASLPKVMLEPASRKDLNK